MSDLPFNLFIGIITAPIELVKLVVVPTYELLKEITRNNNKNKGGKNETQIR